MSYVKGGFQDKKRAALKGICILMGILVYLSMIGYTGWHNIQLMLRGVKGDFIVVAIVGIVALEITATFLPLALKYWTLDFTHQIAAAVFYVVDLLLIGMNSFANFNVEAGQALPDWVQVYVHVIVPITPIICGIGWALLFTLDPISKVTARQAHIELESELLYLDSKAKHAEEDADYRAMIESKAKRDQLSAGMRQFGITEKTPAKLPPAPKKDISKTEAIYFSADGGDNETEQEEAGPGNGNLPFRSIVKRLKGQ